MLNLAYIKYTTGVNGPQLCSFALAVFGPVAINSVKGNNSDCVIYVLNLEKPLGSPRVAAAQA